MVRRTIALVALLAACGAACNESALQTSAPDAGPAVGGLAPEQAQRIVAKIGDKAITLGDYALALERMDQFDRLRYQTKERRRELLADIVDVELLALEARKRGLDKSPEVEDAIRQILRDAMLAKARQGIPAPAAISAEEIRAYYDAHQDDFREPERRRVSAIIVEDEKAAKKVLESARKAKSATEWGELFFKHSLNAPKQKPNAAPADLAGDLGIVGPPDDAKGANVRVPDAVRKAVFALGAVGEVAPDAIVAEGKHYIVRLSGITAPHTRSLQEADRGIRVAILQQKMLDQERALEEELRKKFAVEIDDKALEGVKMPAALENLDAGTGASSYANRPGPGAQPDAGAPSPDGG
jgi:hypothetical protein